MLLLTPGCVPSAYGPATGFYVVRDRFLLFQIFLGFSLYTEDSNVSLRPHAIAFLNCVGRLP